MTTTNQSPAALRAEAERLENEVAKQRKGNVFISPYSGAAFIHSGLKEVNTVVDGCREATEAEVTALCIIPEFKAYLEKVREG